MDVCQWGRIQPPHSVSGRIPVGSSATTIAICLATLAYHPSPDVHQETVDLAEINHFHDDQGRPVFDQILFYEWSADQKRYQVRDWRLLKSTAQIPLPSARDGVSISVWNDFKARDTLREIRAKVVRETWTQYDPELVEREFLPESKRRKLKEASVLQKKNAASQASVSNGSSATAPAPSTAPLQPLQAPVPR